METFGTAAMYHLVHPAFHSWFARFADWCWEVNDYAITRSRLDGLEAEIRELVQQWEAMAGPS